MNFKMSLLILFIFTPLIGFTMPSNDTTYWVCKTMDNNNLEWIVKNKYKKIATNLAFDACKKQSKNPKSCKTSANDCEGFQNGFSTKPLWQCSALDKGTGLWKSNYYAHRDDAAIAAKDYCKTQSTIPETCYVNLIGCINANTRF